MMSMTMVQKSPPNPFLISAVRLASYLHRILWLTRALTIGVRAVVLDERGSVLLVRHTYMPGWYFPGGGIGRRETTEAAVIRELREEAGIDCLERPVLHGFFRQVSLKRDHVACYVVRGYAVIPGAQPDWEIAETGFFPADALPPGTTAGTRARLAEILQGKPIAQEW